MALVQAGGKRAAWRRIASELDWALFVVVVVLAIATACTDRLRPVQRPFLLTDATISYPYAQHDMHFAVALLVPFVLLLATMAAFEFVVFKQRWPRAASHFINGIVTQLGALAVVGFMTELFKTVCGRLRPDFLARCDPILGGNGELELQQPLGSFPAVKCRGAVSEYDLRDGRQSFPSGHSSCSMAIGLFCALYIVWATSLRGGGALAAKLLERGQGWRRRLWHEVVQFVAFCVLLFSLAWPWGVGVSRFRDNRHNVSDIVGGFLLAGTFVPLFALRFVARVRYFDLQDAAAAGGAGGGNGSGDARRAPAAHEIAGLDGADGDALPVSSKGGSTGAAGVSSGLVV